MTEIDSHPLPEDHGFLWLLVAPPAIWGGHFLVSYVVASVWCTRLAGRDSPASGVVMTIVSLTGIALAGIVLIGWGAYRRSKHGGDEPPHDRDKAEDRHRFLGHATLLLAGLSAVATIFSAVATSFFDTCR